MMAAISASGEGKRVILLERNEKLGKKLFITGKGRCNITNACDAEEFLSHVATNSRFLYSSFSRFNNDDMIRLLNDAGLKTKVERGQRVFPQSDHSSDVIGTLKRICDRNGVQIHYHTKVEKILLHHDAGNAFFAGVQLSDGKTIKGGFSHPCCRRLFVYVHRFRWGRIPAGTFRRSQYKTARIHRWCLLL